MDIHCLPLLQEQLYLSIKLYVWFLNIINSIKTFNIINENFFTDYSRGKPSSEAIIKNFHHRFFYETAKIITNLKLVCAIFVKKRCNLHSVLDANLHVRKCAIFVKKKYITNRQT